MFGRILEFLIFASVGIALVRTYLSINKIWIRKHDEEVAKSISVFATLLGLLANGPFFISYAFIEHDYKSALNMALALTLLGFLLLVGAGVWVPTPAGHVSFWTKFKRAVKLEKNEAGDLVKAFIMPRGADLILKILARVATIDRHVDEKEIDFIQAFAKSWNLDFDPAKVHAMIPEGDGHTANYIELRKLVVSYVKLSPPAEQAAHLRDVIASLARIDDEVSEEETIVMEEINGVLDSYAESGARMVTYDVVIAPQSDDQKEAIRILAPDAVESRLGGGVGFVVGEYYSEKIARMVCDKYRSLGLFTAIEKVMPERA